MRLQRLVEIKMTLPPVSRVASCMHKFLWKCCPLLEFVRILRANIGKDGTPERVKAYSVMFF